MGQSPDSSSYNADREGLPFYQGNADFGEIHPTPRTWCSDPKKVAEPGDILLSVRAPVGAINVANERCCIGRGLAAIRPARTDISGDYISLILQSRRTYLDSMSTGSTFKAIGKKALYSCEIPVYPNESQSRIVDQFHWIDHCLCWSRKQLSAFDDLVKSEFAEMFGDPCDPTSTCFPKVALKDICELRIGPFGSALHKEDYVSDCHPIVNPSHITNGRIVIDNDLTVDEETFESMESYHLHTDDVVLGRRGEIGRCAVVEDEGLLCGTGCMILRPNRKECRSDYLQRIVSFPSFAAALEREAVGVTMKNLNAKIVGNALVNMPPIALQQQFADFVTKVDKLRFDCCRMTTYCDTVFSSVSARLLCT